MLAKILQLNDAEKQKTYLSSLLESISKNCRQLILQVNEQLIKNLEKVTFKQNFALWLQLCINLLSIQECFQYADINTKADSPLLRLIDTIGKLQHPQKYQKVNTIHQKYPSIEQSLVLHTFLAKHSIAGTPQTQYPRLLPIFIRLSSNIIQKYLQLKNEPAKDSQDRIEDDKVVIKCCEKWVAENFVRFFGGLGSVKGQEIRGLVLMAVGDVAGALLEIDRSGVVEKELLEKILDSLVRYCKKNYQLNQIHNIFSRSLSSKCLNNPLKKLQIPQIYSEYSLRTVGLNTQGYAYLVTKYLNSGLLALSSRQLLLSILAPVVAESLARPYEIKIQLIYMLERLLEGQGEGKGTIQVRSGWEFGYPIQLLLFYFWQFQNQRFGVIRSRFNFETQDAFILSLLKLNEIYLDNLSKQKSKYILKTLLKQKLVNQKTFLILRTFTFKQQKSQLQKLLLQVLQSLNEKYKNRTSQLAGKWRQQVGQKMEEEVRQKFKGLVA